MRRRKLEVRVSRITKAGFVKDFELELEGSEKVLLETLRDKLGL